MSILFISESLRLDARTACQNLAEQANTLPWLSALRLLNITGLADAIQLHSELGLPQKTFERLLGLLQDARVIPQPLVAMLPSQIRPGKRGKPPRVFGLTELGAAVLQLHGVEARPSGLTDSVAITHALAMLDLYLRASKENLAVVVDKPLIFNENRSIRPDIQITLSDGRVQLLEIEQELSRQRVLRSRESLSNRWDFFNSPASATTAPSIGIVFALPPGKRFDKTVYLWQRAWQMLTVERGTPPPFDVWVMPLPLFLSAPVWQPAPQTAWQYLESSAPPEVAAEPVVEPLPNSPTPAEDLNYLQALYATLPEPQPLTAAPNFFALMLLFHKAARQAHGDTPTNAITLLNAYLERHPTLRTRLTDALRRERNRVVWNDSAILRHQQRVIDTFLAYHGWHNRRNRLFAHGYIAENARDEMYPFGVKVALMMGLDDYLRGEGIAVTSPPHDALAWTLWALFAFASELNLPAPAYW
ncbi:MAG: hypothetical protein OHK0052_20650 [Anaerolineales bacterium]